VEIKFGPTKRWKGKEMIKENRWKQEKSKSD